MEVHYIEFIDFKDGPDCVLFLDSFGNYKIPSAEYLINLKSRLEQTIEHHDALTVWSDGKNSAIQKENEQQRQQWRKQKRDRWNGVARYIYLIKNADRGIYKIGISKQPKVRLRQLQIVTTDKLELVGFKRGNYELEKRLHEKYNHLNLSGEWFSPCAELIDEFSTLDL